MAHTDKGRTHNHMVNQRVCACDMVVVGCRNDGVGKQMTYLIRFQGNLQGTQGMLFLPSGWNCCTIEPPWLDNIKNRSCVPAGEYKMALKDSPKFGLVYEVKDVPDRTNILIHIGNYAGDEESGYYSDTKGCIMPGERHGILNNQEVVLNSRGAFDLFMEMLNGEPFDLTIKGASDA